MSGVVKKLKGDRLVLILNTAILLREDKTFNGGGNGEPSTNDPHNRNSRHIHLIVNIKI